MHRVLLLLLALAAAGCQTDAPAPDPAPASPEAAMSPDPIAPEAEPSRTGGQETIAAMQGTWRSTDDPLSVIQIEGDLMTSVYDGETLDEQLMRPVRGCMDLTKDPMSPIFVVGTEDPMCFEIDGVDATSLAYFNSARGNRLAYERVAE